MYAGGIQPPPNVVGGTGNNGSGSNGEGCKLKQGSSRRRCKKSAAAAVTGTGRSGEGEGSACSYHEPTMCWAYTGSIHASSQRCLVHTELGSLYMFVLIQPLQVWYWKKPSHMQSAMGQMAYFMSRLCLTVHFGRLCAFDYDQYTHSAAIRHGSRRAAIDLSLVVNNTGRHCGVDILFLSTVCCPIGHHAVRDAYHNLRCHFILEPFNKLIDLQAAC